MTFNTNSDAAGFMLFAMIVFWAITIVVHICFATAVMKDADTLPGGRRPIFVGPVIWFLGTLLGGVFVAAAYWAMHHSRLNSTIPTVPPDQLDR
jgi:hypothetical protein